uniref:SAM-dependent methyltransferase n=1 Tax=Amorphochlora amoebiformis TaxID=1561963 RepID=A0A0H5BIU7_9EUKA|nr:SAM-dependent methyltransferase [Amorphochlora amoebiformis]
MKDKYYYLAIRKKFYFQHSFRSRAAFKLIQINKKFFLLKNHTSIIDLCSFPGSWLQVGSQLINKNKILLGVDLIYIKPLKEIYFLKTNIKNKNLSRFINKKFLNLKFKCLLNDGSPNIGGIQSLTSYNQNVLVKYGIMVLLENIQSLGDFVTKIFLTENFFNFVYVFRNLFVTTIIYKPSASRLSSSEYYIIGKGLKKINYSKKALFKCLFLSFKIERLVYKKNYLLSLSSDKPRFSRLIQDYLRKSVITLIE